MLNNCLLIAQVNEWATESIEAEPPRLTAVPFFLSCSSHTCPRHGVSAGPQRWDSTSFLFTVSPPVGLTVRRATLWRIATAAWSTCQVSARGGVATGPRQGPPGTSFAFLNLTGNTWPTPRASKGVPFWEDCYLVPKHLEGTEKHPL